LTIKISPRTNASAPEGVRIYAIGDIHGRLDLLDKMLGLIDSDMSGRKKMDTTLLFLGDYVDRGSDSKGVVSRLIDGLPAGVTPVFLKGNHEDLLLTFLDRSGFGLNWLHNGGDRALISYGIELEVIANAYWSAAGLTEAAAIFQDLLPESHLNFFRSLRLSHRMGDYFFAHAGVKPGVPLEDQSAEDLLWIRKEFLSHSKTFGAVVVHGHTPSRTPQDLDNRIGIDTLAFHTGKLTAVGLEGVRRWFIST
jgi:serine/threonine protein phosphatase 1